MRKLATIQRIEKLNPIPNADLIQQAHVLGWSIVVLKTEFQVGDLCVFFEIDSVLPEEPWAEFLRPRNFRIKTAKMRGVLSQGLALPISILPASFQAYEIGTDVTEILGVKKYEPPAPPEDDSVGERPGYIPSNDELRLQGSLFFLDELRGKDFYITIKCDGTSFSAVHDGERLIVSSRRMEKKETPQSKYWLAARKHQLEEKLTLYPNFSLHAELCGPGIEQNHLGLKDVQLFAFDVFDVKAGRYLDYADFLGFCHKIDVPTVPLLYPDIGKNFQYTLDELLELARGKYEGTTTNREGIVVRPISYSRAANGERLSFKVLNNDFLLKEEK